MTNIKHDNYERKIDDLTFHFYYFKIIKQYGWKDLFNLQTTLE